ncbi:MAG: chorismate synthase [Termitinemataceae bacterium]|nr:MAG: chorismate synthase [Termitinemataceae bacterium]
MAGSIFGKLFKVVTFGESHGVATGCVVDGCPSGVPLSFDFVSQELARRRPGGGGSATTRAESDTPEILSGVFSGITLGTPIAIIIRNSGAHSTDYDALKDVYRPGHADFSFDAKYGVRDHRGGGRGSGRETAARVAAGAVAKAFLGSCGANGEAVSIHAWVSQMASLDASSKESAAKIEALRKEGDSAGGIICCRIEGLNAGLGETVFDKLDARLAQAMLSIGAVKGFEIGAGFAAAALKGSQNNDTPDRDTNNCGGVLGGMSTGGPVEFRVAFKPVPSISKKQQALDVHGNLRTIEIGGRHDVCICPRAVPVVEAMAALVIADLVLENRCAKH